MLPRSALSLAIARRYEYWSAARRPDLRPREIAGRQWVVAESPAGAGTIARRSVPFCRVSRRTAHASRLPLDASETPAKDSGSAPGDRIGQVVREAGSTLGGTIRNGTAAQHTDPPLHPKRCIEGRPVSGGSNFHNRSRNAAMRATMRLCSAARSVPGGSSQTGSSPSAARIAGPLGLQGSRAEKCAAGAMVSMSAAGR